jgi:hypothetical protein
MNIDTGARVTGREAVPCDVVARLVHNDDVAGVRQLPRDHRAGESGPGNSKRRQTITPR